jgi:septal ring factor EnvC (AmiA/AmiB activator)
VSKYLILVILVTSSVFGVYYKSTQSKISSQEKTIEVQKRTVESLMSKVDKVTSAYKIVLENNKRLRKENKLCSINYL